MNLATNAVEAMPDGGLLSIRVEGLELDAPTSSARPDAAPAGCYVALSVRDTGHGMSETVRGRCFEPFFTTKKVGEGSGLGLSLVYGVVHQFDGFVDLISAPGVGTTFRILLPVE